MTKADTRRTSGDGVAQRVAMVLLWDSLLVSSLQRERASVCKGNGIGGLYDQLR